MEKPRQLPVTTTGTHIADVRKIAVLRANGIGDYIFALPALDALRHAYPEAEIVLLGRRWHAATLNGRPGPLDRVIAVPHSPGVNDEPARPGDEALDDFFARMHDEHFDLALQLHGGGRNSNPFLLRLGARVTAGMRTPDAPPLDRWVPYIYFQREVLRYLEVVSLVGAPVTDLEPHFAVTPADLAESLAILPDQQDRPGPSTRPLVILHPGAGDPERRWPPEKFATTGDALARAGAQVALIGTADEGALIAAVAQAMQEPAVNTSGQLSLGGLAGLLSRAAVVLSNDSGPLHLAAAVGAPTVGIYWGFNVVNAGPITTARSRPVIAWRVHCPVCGTDRSHSSCAHSPSFVADVAVDDVLAAALDLLALFPSPSHRSPAELVD